MSGDHRQHANAANELNSSLPMRDLPPQEVDAVSAEHVKAGVSGGIVISGAATVSSAVPSTPGPTGTASTSSR